MDDDFVIDDLFAPPPKKKKNSGRIGKSAERELAKVFSERFPNHPPFSRVVGSGNRWAQVKMSKEAQSLMASDLVCPPGFRFAIESKYGYADIDLIQAVTDGNAQLDGFLKQASDSAERADRTPIACWRKPWKEWLVFSRESVPAENYVAYRGWRAVSIADFLKMPDEFFFSS